MSDRDFPARRPSPFTAAFLSFLFPGLGQLYAGVRARALAFAAAPVLLLALLAGLLANHATRRGLVFSVFDPTILQILLVLDGALFAYRLLAVVDAFRVARALAAGGSSRLGRPRLRLAPLSLAGLGAVVLVMAMGHVALARYDLIAYDTITGITSGTPEQATPPAGASASPGPSASAAAASAPPSESPSPTPTAAPVTAVTPWNGTDRLNILLLGVDQRPPDPTFNTDTMIIASVDPKTGQVAMFSVPRDTIDMPLPPSWPAASYFQGGVFPNKITTLWTYADSHPNLFPGPAATKGSTALMGTLGYLLGLNINYYVMVNFSGFEQVVNTLGGVTINVQAPVEDYHYPSVSHGAIKLYIPATIQHMDGSEALAYARSRHETNDFNRSQRQQRVILSVREQTNLATFLDPNKLAQLSSELSAAVHTNFPAGQLPQLVSLAEQADVRHLHSYVFSYPDYETQCSPAECQVFYWLKPKVDLIRQTVQQAFSASPELLAERQALRSEAATVWVLNGSGIAGQATAVSGYLDYLGMNAEVPPVNGGHATGPTQTATVVTFYNGAESKLPETVRVLEAVFKVKIVTATDPSMKADVVVITGTSTPKLSAPAG